MRFVRVLTWVGVGLIGAATVLVAGAASAASALTVTPSTGLVDGQVVDVAGSGFLPSTTAYVVECVAGLGQDGCDLTTLATSPTDATGAFTRTFAVRTMLHTNAGVFDCRMPATPCILGANTGVTPAGAASAGLAFDPAGPLLPRGTAVATPATNLVDRQVVGVNGSGFSPMWYLELRQCVAGARSVDGCRPSFYGSTSLGRSLTGSFVTSMRVYAMLRTQGGALVDCRLAPNTCEIQVGVFGQVNDTVPVAIDFDPGAPLAPSPTLVVDPSTDLVDGQVVRATGSGYDPFAAVTIDVCAIDEALVIGCEHVGFTVPQPDGSIDATFGVVAVVDSYDPGPPAAYTLIDCRLYSAGCELRAFQDRGYDHPGVAPIAFAADADLKPPPVLMVDPVSGLVDGQDVVLSGTGFPIGRQPGPGAGGGTNVHQCVAASPNAVDCRAGFTTFGIDANGDFTATLAVVTVFVTNGGQVIDCRATACVLRAGTFGDPTASADALLVFDADAELTAESVALLLSLAGDGPPAGDTAPAGDPTTAPAPAPAPAVVTSPRLAG